MAFPAKSSVQSIDDDSDESSEDTGKGAAQGPPSASPSPRSASDSSLYSQAGKDAQSAGQSGLGGEGSQPALVGVQGLALIQRGVQMLNLAFPENPGLVATLADLIGRLQQMVPTLVQQSANQGMGLLSQMSAGMQQPQVPGMPQPGMGMPGAGGPMGSPMGAAPPMGGPMGPPPQGMPMPGQMPPPPMR